jgi:hypothetical protein
MPLHAITSAYGEAGLRERLSTEIAVLPEAERELVGQALAMAARLHAADRRQREPYVNHLLRVAIRIVSHYKVRDPEVVCAALLHDAVEDHAGGLAAGGDHAAALAVLAGHFGGRVAGLVAAVTNPVWQPGRDEREQYREHTVSSLEANPWARVIKVSDFTDNAVGLMHTTGPKLHKLAAKYRPLAERNYMSERTDVLRLWSLLTLRHVELDLLILVQRPVARRCDRGEVDEYIRGSVLGGDETKALVSVKPLHRACCHVFVSFLSVTSRRGLAAPTASIPALARAGVRGRPSLRSRALGQRRGPDEGCASWPGCCRPRPAAVIQSVQGRGVVPRMPRQGRPDSIPAAVLGTALADLLRRPGPPAPAQRLGHHRCTPNLSRSDLAPGALAYRRARH